MARFGYKKYLQELEAAESIDQISTSLLPKLKGSQNYIFISYSHRDYKQVYRDLAELRKNDIPFWYDEGLPAGENWDDVVRKKMAEPNCAGVIFYISDSLFVSQSIQTEIKIVLGEDTHPDAPKKQIPYFAVNLTDQQPSDILDAQYGAKKFPDAVDKMAAKNEWSNTLARAFPDKSTYLPISHARHIQDLLDNIQSRFSIYGKTNPYKFDNAPSFRGSGTIKFENGNIYEGEFADGMFDGQGKMSYKDGTVYEGAWKNSRRHGQGTITYYDGITYSGEWQDGVYHGIGTHTDAQSQHTGQWKDGLANGVGFCTYTDGTVYTGQWKDGDLHGECIAYWPNGEVYVGQCKNGLYHGKGTYRFADGAEYAGQWKDDKRHGEGVMRFPDGAEYTGQWKEGKHHGEGVYRWPDGAEYTGQWKDGKRQGEGTMRFSSGAEYTGQWKDDNRHGKGILRYSDGDVYDGDWVNGEQKGQCTVIRTNGHRYVGGWGENGSKGQGTEYYPDGASRSGIWDGENLIEGKGILRYDDGCWYDGEIRNNLRHGRGVYTLADGTVLSGIFRDDELVEPLPAETE